MLIDTHAHLNDVQYEHDLNGVLEHAKEADVQKIITIGYDLNSSQEAVRLAHQYHPIYAAVGIHPDEALSWQEETYQKLQDLAKQSKVVAIGEIGLDYYWDKAPRERQQEMFRKQIRLANELSLPISVHDRDAHGDVLHILEEERPKSGVLHCFSGSLEMAERCLALGLYLSFGGPLTFKNAKKAVEVARVIPLDRIVLETDCPYLTPHPYRGKRNEPAKILLTAEKLAEIKGISLDTVKISTTSNAEQIFALKV